MKDDRIVLKDLPEEDVENYRRWRYALKTTVLASSSDPIQAFTYIEEAKTRASPSGTSMTGAPSFSAGWTSACSSPFCKRTKAVPQ